MKTIQDIYENQWLHFSLSFVIGVLVVALHNDIIRIGILQNILFYVLWAIWGINYVFWILNDYCYRFGNLIGLATGILMMYGMKVLFHL